MFDFVSTETAQCARDSVPESTYSPSFVDEALAVAYGINAKAPTRDHLLALIEHYGITHQPIKTTEGAPF